jgi:hypothetical protein
MPDLKMITLAPNGNLQTRPDIDLSFDSQGKIIGGPAMVTGKDAATQDVLRGLLTVLGTNPSCPNFGTILSSLVGSRSVEDVTNTLSSEIQTVLGYLSNVSANFDPSEQIVQIVNLKVTQVPRTIQASLTVQTGTGAQATVSVSP